MSETTHLLLTGTGFIGVGLVLLAFFLLQTGRVGAHSLPYAGLNIAGSCGVLVSLAAAWNWPSAIMQISWISITLYGMALRAWKR